MAVGVIFGGPSPEHDVSVLTGLQAARALSGAGRDVFGLYWSKSGRWYEVGAKEEAGDFVQGAPKGATEVSFVASPDGGFIAKGGRFGRERRVEMEAALVCCHGGPGEDGTLQASLDLAGIPYAGPSAWGGGLSMDKLAFGGLIQSAGLPCLPRALLGASEVGFDPPYIVKPRFGGSSIGIEIVGDLDTALALGRTSPHMRRGGVLEPWRSDLADLNIAVRTWPELAFSAIEKPLKATGGEGILSYADKYVGGEGMVSAPRELPAAIPEEMAAKVRGLAGTIAQLAGVRGVARIDFLASDSGELYVNELNAIPGSLAKYLWVDPPVAFPTLLVDLLEEARRRPSASYSSEGADGSALRSAGSIASKLA